MIVYTLPLSFLTVIYYTMCTCSLRVVLIAIICVDLTGILGGRMAGLTIKLLLWQKTHFPAL